MTTTTTTTNLIHYYNNNKEQIGPINESNLKDLFINKEINTNTFVWMQSFGKEWKKLQDLNEIFSWVNNDKKTSKKRKRKNNKKPNYLFITNLPTNETEEQIAKSFSKYGVMQLHIETGHPLVYRMLDEQDKFTGNCIVVYEKPESVLLAIQMLDDTYYSVKNKIRVSASKDLHKDFDELKKQIENKSNKNDRTAQRLMKIRKNQVKQSLSWDEEGLAYNNGNKIVIIKHLFTLKDFEEDEDFEEDLQNDLIEECSKLGEIKKITIFKHNPEGVVMIKFLLAAAAEKCVKLMNKRFFDAKQLDAHYWDGITDYRTNNNEQDEEARLKKFGDFLEEN